jgi:hypothetical protein
MAGIATEGDEDIVVFYGGDLLHQRICGSITRTILSS